LVSGPPLSLLSPTGVGYHPRVRSLPRNLTLALSTLVLSLLGCREDMTPVDGWAMLDEELFGTETNTPLEPARANRCPMNRRDYCVEDEAFVRGAVQPELDEHAGGSMPPTRSKVRKLMTGLRYAYGERLRSDEGLGLVRALIRARFAEPVVGEVDGEWVLDYGVLPFDIGSESKSFTLGPLTDPDIWSPADIGHRLQSALVAYPEAKRIHLVTYEPKRPSRGSGISLSARHVLYHRGGVRVVQYTEDGKNRYITTLPGQRGLAALADSELSLEPEKCVLTRDRPESPGEHCLP